MQANGVCYSENFTTHHVVRGEKSADNSWGYRPRGSLARVLYEKQKQDEYLSNIDKYEWYQCNLDKLPESIASKFVQLNPDQDTVEFLQRSEEKSDWVLTQLWHSIAKALLGWFMTQTSINGWLQRGSMFVISMAQFLKLMQADENWRAESFLDLGAGDGEVTTRLAPLFHQVYATEMSPTMRTLLQKRGYQVLDIDNWHQEKKYDVVSCLNLLDRCDTPLQILEQIKSSLKPDGKVLLALVLPFSAYVEAGGSTGHKPKELLPIYGDSFEEQVKTLVENVMDPLGFDVISWSRVPYLSEGDLHQSYYWLDDVVLVLKSKMEIS